MSIKHTTVIFVILFCNSLHITE